MRPEHDVAEVERDPDEGVLAPLPTRPWTRTAPSPLRSTEERLEDVAETAEAAEVPRGAVSAAHVVAAA